MKYKAFVVEESEGKYISSIQTLDTANLPEGKVLVRVHYSSLNYKDALSAIGNKGVTKNYPHTPGIDAAGVVIESSSSLYQPDDEVIVTGYDLGMDTPGGYGEYIRVPAEWVVKLPKGLSLKESMIIGTAGFTAGISVLRLSELIKPEDGSILVSGATGGVGSIAVSILAKLGYHVIAITGKENEVDFLKECGAAEHILRADFMATKDRALFRGEYAGAIDTVGGDLLARMVKSLKPNGVATTCGSVSSTDLPLNVFPFILRAVRLIGISAQNYPTEERPQLWELLADEYKTDNLLKVYREISIEELKASIELILKGELKGRTIIKHN